MSVKTGVLSLSAGLAAFFGFGMATAAITGPLVEYELLLGLLAGTIAGGVATAAVAVTFAPDVPSGRRRIAGTVTGFGVGFFVGLVGGVIVVHLGTVQSIGAGFALGILSAYGVSRSGFASDGEAESDPGTGSELDAGSEGGSNE
ncbi:hypothetical protein [Halobiforma nitratireducens]|uniref:DUF8147 domain-containing protein n=1 Tax=Halobiforma nitratireducens JCM 10879 TaxID=1227454 RepID=M0LTG2_9EURY|nr:hypothetical protein [Halobiforma nitratireducens]EMA36847.1 hypothetical protein C446_11197 [Halobiforma nitratireducens JCM 10879]